jgi:hypothetical protein
MQDEPTRSPTTTADVLGWQTNYRIALALLAGAVTVGLRTLGSLNLSPVADRVVGTELAEWFLGLVPVGYAVLVIGIRAWVQRRRAAGQTLSTLMAVADLAVVFWLVFLLARVEQYHLGLLLALFSLQLTHVYFGRAPALLTLVATATAYLLLTTWQIDTEQRWCGARCSSPWPCLVWAPCWSRAYKAICMSDSARWFRFSSARRRATSAAATMCQPTRGPMPSPP